MECLLRDHLDGTRENPRTVLLQSLFQAESEGGVSETDLIGIVAQIITAGHQTTQDLIGNSIFTLLTHPDQWELVCEDPARAGNAVEEVLRFRSPAQMMSRYAIDDTEIAGEPIAAGEFVIALLGSANHDETYFSDPQVFSVERENARHHLAFSRGVHFCLGAALSRLEAKTLIGTLARRFPDARLAVPESELAWEPNTFLLSLSSLPVALGADHA
jgi:cytochrome P450